MDREKVIKGLECCTFILGRRKCNECPYQKGLPDNGCYQLQDDFHAMLEDDETQLQYRDDHIAMYQAEVKRLEALLKEQEAVTIKKTKEHGFGVYGGICPKCRNWIQSAHSFCGFCGQAVKWE